MKGVGRDKNRVSQSVAAGPSLRRVKPFKSTHRRESLEGQI